MRIAFFYLFLVSFLAGCGNFSPRLQNRIDNKDGKIDEIKNNQNGIMLEIGKLRQQAEIQNSQLNEVQQGFLNLNAAGVRNENKGIQILQGDGALIMVFSIIALGMFLLYYKNKSDKNEKIANVLAGEVMLANDPVMNDNILRSARFTPLEKPIFEIMKKNLPRRK
jgi:hypothetical protein